MKLKVTVSRINEGRNDPPYRTKIVDTVEASSDGSLEIGSWSLPQGTWDEVTIKRVQDDA